MKQVFYTYSSNIKRLPKGLLILVILLLLILIPLILSLALIGVAIALATSILSNLLPFKKKEVKPIDKKEPLIIDITPKDDKR